MKLEPDGQRKRSAGAESSKEERMQDSTYLDYEERRHSRRTPSMKAVSYCLSGNKSAALKTFDRNGRVIDISETGLCIQTVNPLSEGHVIYFDDSINLPAGVVKWCRELDEFYRAGIELRTDIVVTDRNIEEVRAKSLPAEIETAEYAGILDEATMKFNAVMADIEERINVHQETPEAIEAPIVHAIEEMIQACEVFENNVADKEVIRKARIRFRQKTDQVFSKSYCVNRTRIWPQGSQGDYKTLEILYKNTPLSEGVGYYLDRIMLSVPLAEAVRDRIKKLELMLKEELVKRRGLSILNIACGACRELVGIVPEIKDSGAKVVCIDNDNDALDYAQSRLADAGLRENIEFYKYNALRLFDYEMSMEDFGAQDIIYSVGLFDYLPSDFLVKMFGTLYRMLNPGGRFIPAFKDAGRYRPQYYHWFADWDGFLQRTERDFKKILSEAGIPSSAITEVRDKTGIIVFYVATK
jgi:SAM-dependent methyltransferase